MGAEYLKKERQALYFRNNRVSIISSPKQSL